MAVRHTWLECLHSASRAAAFLALICLLLAEPAAADHLRPIDISPAGASASYARVASDGAGTVVAVWREIDDEGEAVRARVRTAAGTWEPARRVSAPAPHTEGPAVAMDREGNAAAVWHSWAGGDASVFAAVRPAGGSWTTPEQLSPPGLAGFKADVAVAAGRAVVVWAAVEGGLSIVQTTSRMIGSGGWLPAETISSGTSHAYTPRIALSDTGSAVAVWRWWRSGYFVIQAALRSPDGSWSAPEDLSAPGEDSRPPRVAMDAAGAAVAAWIRPTGSNTMAFAAYRPAAGPWEPARALSARGRTTRTVEVTMNRAGDAVVGWRHEGVLWSSLRPRDAATWRPRLSTYPYCARCVAAIALDEAGNATAAWSASATVEASFKPAAADEWQRSYMISEWGNYAYDPRVAIERPGEATAVWIREGSTHDRVQAVSYSLSTSAEEYADDDATEACYEEAVTEEDFDECAELENDFDDGEDFRGTAEADVLMGTPGNDVFWGLGGNDVIHGRGGHDVVYGGDGRDRIFGGGGSDRLMGGPGRDRIIGGSGRDRLTGGREADVLAGGRGSDRLLGRDRARDTARGGSGFDRYRLDRRLDQAIGIESRL